MADRERQEKEREETRQRRLAEIRSVNAALEGFIPYIQTQNELPDKFAMFSMIDKMQLMFFLSKAMSKGLLESSCGDLSLSTHEEVIKTRENIDKIFDHFQSNLKLMRDVTMNMKDEKQA